MKINEILTKNGDDAVSELKKRRYTDLPDAGSAAKALEPEKHDINDLLIRPDRRVKVDNAGSESEQKVIDTGNGESGYKIEKVARIKLALQKLIVKRSVAFLFGNPVAYNATTKTENEKLLLKGLKRILYDVKSNSLNRKVARAVFSFKECAELWYPVEKPNNNYGFPSKFKLRCILLSPAFGDTLYPYFDEIGDMAAFSREFTRDKTTYFETYTDELQYLWEQGTNGYELSEGYPKKIAIGKIPVVYAYQEEFETQDVDSLIDRLELLLSNFADTNDYHAAPKIFIKGELKGFSKKGESGAIIEGEDGSDAKYLSWQNAPESVKLEIETLLRMIYTITQTPDISFDSVKGLSAISGIALKLLFMDAHLKVQDKLEIFDEYLQRRVNVITSFIANFNTALDKEAKDMEIEPEITPYMLTSEMDDVKLWLEANGNKPLISHKQSVKAANLSQDPDEDWNEIQSESVRQLYSDSFEPTV